MMPKSAKQKLPFFCALLLLFFTQTLFCVTQYDMTVVNRWLTGAEMLFFFVFYVISLFELPAPVLHLWTAVGCAALTVGYLFASAQTEIKVYLAVTYLPVCLFYLSQHRGDTKMPFASASVLTVLMHLSFWGFLAAIVAAVLTYSRKTYTAFVYYSVGMLLLLCVLYVCMMRLPAKKAVRPAKGGEPAAQKKLRLAFLFAVISMLEAAVYFFFDRSTALPVTVPMLWAVNLFMLYEKGHPLVRAFAAGAQQKLRHFLQNTSD